MGKAMTIDSSLSRIRYVGNGVTTNFSIPFAYLTNNDGTAQLAVYIGDSDTPLIEKDDYTIEGIKGSQVGEAAFEDKFDSGTVIFKTAPESGVAIAVIRNVPQTQSIVFIEGSKFPAQDFENGLDKLTMEVQEVKENLQRAIVLPPTSTENPLEARDDVLRARDEAVQSSNDALRAISEANKTLDEVVKYADQAVADINTTAETAQANITNAITEALDYVSEEAVNVATNVVAGVVGQYTDRAETAAKNAEADASRTAESANQASASATSAATSASEAGAIAGEVSVYNFKNKITNCITEIPQDIKLELNNGTLTLKAGSVLYEPSGAGNFIKHTTTQDYSWAYGSGQYIIIAQESGNIGQTTALAKAYSGATAPSNPSSGDVWYDTTNNIIKRYGTSWVASNFCLPIAIVTSASSTVTSIDQVFNGFGYIGSTIYALPGVKGLIPNGRNEDGSLRNIEIVLDDVKMVTNPDTNNALQYLMLESNGAFTRGNWYYEQTQPPHLFPNNNNIWYNPETNKMYYYRSSTNQFYRNFIFTGLTFRGSTGSTTISEFNQAKLPFRAVDQNDFNKLDEEAVKTIGDQTISSIKTFNQQIVRDLKVGGLYIKGISPVLRENIPSNNIYTGVSLQDANGKYISILDTQQGTSGENYMRMLVYSPNGTSCKIGVFAKDGITRTEVPTPVANSNTTEIATTAWVNTALRGSIMAYAGATAPTGWLKCDGSAVSRTTYSALFAIIGTTYGAGNGSTTFNLPNFVNKTFWGGTGAGKSLSQTLPNIKGTFAGGIGDKATATGAFTRTGTDTASTKVDAVGDSNAYSGLFSFNANSSNSVYQDGAVVRPNVIQTLICIKY